MVASFLRWFQSFLPRQAAMSVNERLVVLVGGFVGIALTAMLTRVAGSDASLPLIIAPMGASAVLVFAAPASPLAQPWPVLGGNIISAVVGVSCVKLLGTSTVAAAVAVAFAIFVMTRARCLHPPGGAVALTTVVGGPAIHNLGYDFVWMPVAVSSVALVMIGLAFNNAMRRRYPHVAAQAPQPVITRALEITRADVDETLAGLDEQLDIDPEDAEALVRAIVAKAQARGASPVVVASAESVPLRSRS